MAGAAYPVPLTLKLSTALSSTKACAAGQASKRYRVAAVLLLVVVVPAAHTTRAADSPRRPELEAEGWRMVGVGGVGRSAAAKGTMAPLRDCATRVEAEAPAALFAVACTASGEEEEVGRAGMKKVEGDQLREGKEV